jgi:hypothetical protein
VMASWWSEMQLSLSSQAIDTAQSRNGFRGNAELKKKTCWKRNVQNGG